MNLAGTPQHDRGFRIALGTVKAAAIGVGGALSILCLMSAMTVVTREVWVQLVPALVVGLGLPLVLAERLVIGAKGERRRGLATDVLASVWLGFAVLYVAGAFPVTSPLLLREADLLDGTWARPATPAVRWLARGTPATQARSAAASPPAPPAAAHRDAGARDADAADAGPLADAEVALDAELEADVEAEADVEVGDEPEALPELAPAQVLEAVAPSVVTISIRRRGRSVAVASGVMIDARGRIATAASAVADAAALAVRLADGRWVEDVTVAALDREAGLAILSIPPGPGLVAARISGPGELAAGARLLVVGNPLGLDPTVAETALAARIELAGGPRLELSTPATLASLGAAVVDLRGVVVGVALFERPPAGAVPARAAPPGVAAPIERAAGAPAPDLRETDGGAAAPLPPVEW